MMRMKRELQMAADRGAEKALSKRRISLRTVILFPLMMILVLVCFIIITLFVIGVVAG